MCRPTISSGGHYEVTFNALRHRALWGFNDQSHGTNLDCWLDNPKQTIINAFNIPPSSLKEKLELLTVTGRSGRNKCYVQDLCPQDQRKNYTNWEKEMQNIRPLSPEEKYTPDQNTPEYLSNGPPLTSARGNLFACNTRARFYYRPALVRLVVQCIRPLNSKRNKRLKWLGTCITKKCNHDKMFNNVIIL